MSIVLWLQQRHVPSTFDHGKYALLVRTSPSSILCVLPGAITNLDFNYVACATKDVAPVSYTKDLYVRVM